MQGISPPKGTSFLIVSNTGYWHNKANSVGMQKLVNPFMNKPLLSVDCSPNASKECPETPGQQDPAANALHLHLLLQIIPLVKSSSVFLCSQNGPESWHLHSLPGLFFFFCSSSFFSQISSPALIITIGSGWMKDLSHLIQWHKYETFIIYSTRRSAKDKFTCDTCKINSYLFLTDFH